MAVFCSARRRAARRCDGSFRIWQPAASGERTARARMGRRRGSVSNRDKPPLNRRHRDNKSISGSLEFFATLRLARAAPSRCSHGRMHDREIFSTAPKRDTGHRQRNRGLLSLQAFSKCRRACETTYSIRDLLGWRAHCLCRDGPRNASRACVSLVDPFRIRAG